MIRHGATSGNQRKCYIGRTNLSLCQEGIEHLQDQHQIDLEQSVVYVTTLARTKETATILFPHAKQVEIASLDEMDFGIFEGKNYQELEQNIEYKTWLETQCEGSCPKGESKAMFVDRCEHGFRKLVEETSETELVMVVHGGTIMALGERLGMPKRTYFEWHVGCGEERIFEWNGQQLEERLSE